MMSSDESVKATDTDSQPATRSGSMQSVVHLPRPLVIIEGSWRRWLQIWDSYETISRLNKEQPRDLIS